MTTLTRADWEQRAQQLKIEGRAFINGEYTDAASGETFDCLSPVDGRFRPRLPAAIWPTPTAPSKMPAPCSNPASGRARLRPSVRLP